MAKSHQWLPMMGKAKTGCKEALRELGEMVETFHRFLVVAIEARAFVKTMNSTLEMDASCYM